MEKMKQLICNADGSQEIVWAEVEETDAKQEATDTEVLNILLGVLE